MNPYTLETSFLSRYPSGMSTQSILPTVNVTLKLSRSSGKAKGDETTSADMPEESGKGNQTT